MNHNKHTRMSLALAAITAFALPASARELPDPDGKPADMTKPVKVFIIMGQSNTLEMGKVGGADKDGTLEHSTKTGGLYPFLVDAAGNWTTRQDVRNVSVMQKRGNMDVYRNDWLTISGGKIGIEIGIGHHLGHHLDEPVMVLKSSIGNRALGWDLLPPGSESFDFTVKDKKTGEDVVYTYAGYKQSPDRWVKGTKPEPISWYAGKQYDDDTANAKKILAELDTYYPGAKGYEVAGFLWWQGDRDSRSAALSSRYEKNLVHLIKQLRKDFDAPNAKFVCASLGQTEKGATDGGGKILDAMFAISDAEKHPEFKGDVATVYTNPISMGGASNSHYGGNAETYMNVGEAMGEAMIKLLEGE